MGQKLILLAFLGLSSLVTSVSQAVVIRQDSKYVYHITPLNQMKDHSDQQLQFVIASSLKVTANYIQDMVAQKFFPRELATIDDFRRLEQANREVDRLLDDINRWVLSSKLRRKLPTKMDLLPDAYFLYFGGKVSGSWIMGGGIGITLAAIVMPVYVVQIDKRTGEQTEGVRFPVEFVVFGSPQFGIGAGGHAGIRGGVGAIWGGPHFADPGQFVGAGVGATGSLGVPVPFLGQVGGNVRAGVLFNDMPGNPDFYFVSAGFEGGPVPAPNAEFHGNLSFVISLQEFFDLFYRASDRALQMEKRKIEIELNNMYGELSGNGSGGVSTPYRPFGVRPSDQ